MLTEFYFSDTSSRSKSKTAPRREIRICTYLNVVIIRNLILSLSPQIGLKVGVRQRGCNGLSYTLDYATSKGKFCFKSIHRVLSEVLYNAVIYVKDCTRC